MTVKNMIEYTVIYKRVKNITLRIRPDGTLEVTAPNRTSETAIREIVEKKQSWITTYQKKTEAFYEERQKAGLKNRYCDGGQAAYLGDLYPLSVTQQGKRSWQWDGKSLTLSGCKTEAHCRQMVEQFYREQMLNEILPEQNRLVRERMDHLLLPEPEFAVRKMRGSWGICYSQKKKIVLNLWLAMAPADCIRQVLIHEYVHFIHNNHSVEFYALLEQLEPQYRQLKHKLSVMVDIKGGAI